MAYAGREGVAAGIADALDSAPSNDLASAAAQAGTAPALHRASGAVDRLSANLRRPESCRSGRGVGASEKRARDALALTLPSEQEAALARGASLGASPASASQAERIQQLEQQVWRLALQNRLLEEQLEHLRLAGRPPRPHSRRESPRPRSRRESPRPHSRRESPRPHSRRGSSSRTPSPPGPLPPLDAALSIASSPTSASAADTSSRSILSTASDPHAPPAPPAPSASPFLVPPAPRPEHRRSHSDAAAAGGAGGAPAGLRPPFGAEEVRAALRIADVAELRFLLLVDHDNDQRATLSLLDAPSLLGFARTLLFYHDDRANQERFEQLARGEGRADVIPLRAVRGRRNAADFVLAQWAGALHATLPARVAFYIVSGDLSVADVADGLRRVPGPAAAARVVEALRTTGGSRLNLWHFARLRLPEADLARVRADALARFAERAADVLRRNRPKTAAALHNTLWESAMRAGERDLFGSDFGAIRAALAERGVRVSGESVRYDDAPDADVEGEGEVSTSSRSLRSSAPSSSPKIYADIVCSYFLEGNCTRKKCPYLHPGAPDAAVTGSASPLPNQPPSPLSERSLAGRRCLEEIVVEVGSSLTEAVARAKPGQRIRIRPGEHRTGGEVEVGKSVEIVGESAESVVLGSLRLAGPSSPAVVSLSIRAAGGGVAVHIAGGGRARLDGCNVAGAVVVEGPGTRPWIVRCTVRDSAAAGVAVEGGAAATVECCRVAGCNGPGVVVRGANAAGRDATATLVVDCEIGCNAAAGVDVCGGTLGAVVARCRLVGGRAAGVLVREASTAEVCHNEIAGNLHEGVGVSGDSAPLVAHNLIAGNGLNASMSSAAQGARLRGDCRAGVELYDRGGGEVGSNEIRENYGGGVLLVGGSRGRVFSNSIHRNWYAGVCLDEGAAADIVDNLIADNGARETDQIKFRRGAAPHGPVPEVLERNAVSWTGPVAAGPGAGLAMERPRHSFNERQRQLQPQARDPASPAAQPPRRSITK